MPRVRCTESPEYEPPPKKKSSSTNTNCVDLKQGEIITDLTGKNWRLGKTVGTGGFGEIYLASEDVFQEVHNNTPYVAKVEKHTSGPLFVEINCYLRIGKEDMIEQWKSENNLNFLGMPHYVASGSHLHNEEKCRFLVIPRYEQDLEAVLSTKKTFNLKTALIISTQIINVLEYIHSHGYIHSDIKASNIMLGKPQITRRKESHVPVSTRQRHIPRGKRVCNRRLRPVPNVHYIDDIPYLEEILKMYEKGWKVSPTSKPVCDKEYKGDQIYLLDYGLATKYILSNGEHRDSCSDQRRAHAGTLLFCSRDAHKGATSRRSDLESLAYNVLYWLTGSLPWIEDLEDPELVEKKKNKFFANLEPYLTYMFSDKYPSFLLEYFKYLGKLEFEEDPDYTYCRSLFKKAQRENGYKDDGKLDFDNKSDSAKKKKTSRGRENGRATKRNCLLIESPRIPLSSNIIFKRPKLRKKIKDKLAKNSVMTWSKILMDDPEVIIKQQRARKTTESSETSPLCLDIESMNPTPAMLDVYNRFLERSDASPRYRSDEEWDADNIDGYTPEMMKVYTIMLERRELEEYEDCTPVKVKKVTRKRKASGQTKKQKRTESPTRAATKNTRIHMSVPRKEAIQVKKVKSVPLKRVYSLRG